jgi:hypothetical protein
MQNDSEATPPYSIWGTIRELLTFAGLITALFYLFGRYYADGYFSALRIDPSLIQLSVADYLISGWQFLWASSVYAGFAIAVVAVLAAAYYLVTPVLEKWLPLWLQIILLTLLELVIVGLSLRDLLAVGMRWLLSDKLHWLGVLVGAAVIAAALYFMRFLMSRLLLSFLEAWRSESAKREREARQAWRVASYTWYLTLFLFIFGPWVLAWAQHAHSKGWNDGITYLQSSSPQVELTSTLPLNLEGATDGARKPDASTYAVVGLRLLRYHNGRYFLYANLDPITCQPLQVFVVEEEKLLSVKTLPGTTVPCTPAVLP